MPSLRPVSRRTKAASASEATIAASAPVTARRSNAAMRHWMPIASREISGTSRWPVTSAT